MSTLTNTATPNPNGPSSLKPRYEIRKLEAQHLPWAAAVMGHSHAFHSTVLGVMYPDRDMGVWLQDLYPALQYLVAHQIASGMSFGVFDREYEFKTAEARKAGGKLFWDPNEPSIEKTQGRKAEGMRMLQQMDFPLVSIALSYDAHVPFLAEKMKPLLDAMPEFGIFYGILAERDTRDPASWAATGPGQVLMRNATSTRHDYEGQGIMAALARWLRREAAAKGYRGIQIECMNDAVTHVWSNGVEQPFRATVVSEFECETWEDEKGKKVFAPARQRATKCWVDLKPEGV
ncbi:hypothetical protein EJ02DRAFT_457640 [Clathrospora elynae]|uniref:N-acetyltransferase domain-containing protein n=1 Tax=Clathrospora elynae TaxID=706981 RepID=A0A6A5SGE2_9PLEO|nr:hypothetical protein EJ02DRAFT_457640 [Clathrospora elynae]